MEKLKTERAIIVEGRDDVTAVSEAADALIIPTHGFGITSETWAVIEKAYKEKGLIILTDPDHAGEEIRRKLTERFPDSVQAYVAREDATRADDIGVENAGPAVIAEALEKAITRASVIAKDGSAPGEDPERRIPPQSCGISPRFADMADLRELGLSGGEGSRELRAKVCRALGIGYGNAGALIKKLKGFGIGLDELKEEIEKIRK